MAIPGYSLAQKRITLAIYRLKYIENISDQILSTSEKSEGTIMSRFVMMMVKMKMNCQQIQII